MKLFNTPLVSKKINFYIVQGYSSEEIYVSLKGLGQACSILCIVRIKINYYHNFKF